MIVVDEATLRDSSTLICPFVNTIFFFNSQTIFKTPNPYTFSDSLGVSIAICDFLSSYISVLCDISIIPIFIVPQKLIMVILKLFQFLTIVQDIALLDFSLKLKDFLFIYFYNLIPPTCIAGDTITSMIFIWKIKSILCSQSLSGAP